MFQLYDIMPLSLQSMSVYTTLGLRALAANPGGSCFTKQCVKPSIAYFEAQYGATWNGNMQFSMYCGFWFNRRNHYNAFDGLLSDLCSSRSLASRENRLIIIPCLISIISGTKWRNTFAIPLIFVWATVSKSSVSCYSCLLYPHSLLPEYLKSKNPGNLLFAYIH